VKFENFFSSATFESREAQMFNVIFDVFRTYDLKLKLQFTNYSLMAYGRTKVVEHSTYYPKFKGLNPAVTDFGRERIAERMSTV
jgi:hypothetical protein